MRKMAAADFAAVNACRDYEHWAGEVKRLTQEIGKVVCPEQEVRYLVEDPDWPIVNGESHFEIERTVLKPRYMDAPDPRTLDEVAEAVKDCPECSRLCVLIRERKHARQRFGVAKRAVRRAGKLAIEAVRAR